MAGFCDSLHTILSVVLQFSLTFYLFSVVKSIGIFQSVLIRLLFTPCPATRCAMHRIYANRINSCDMSRVFCDLRSHKTPRGILPVNSNLIRADSVQYNLLLFSLFLSTIYIGICFVNSMTVFYRSCCYHQILQMISYYTV